MVELRGRNRSRVGSRGTSSTIETCAASYLVLYPIPYSMHSDDNGTGSIDDGEESHFQDFRAKVVFPIMVILKINSGELRVMR